MNDELEQLKKKRLQQLQQQAHFEEGMQEHQNDQQAEFEKQKKAILCAILTTEARERLGRVKIARPEIAENLEQQLIMLVQSGRLKTKINDQQLQGLLKQVIPKKRDITIRRR